MTTSRSLRSASSALTASRRPSVKFWTITSSPSISCGRACAARSAPRSAGRSRTPANRRRRRSLRRLRPLEPNTVMPMMSKACGVALPHRDLPRIELGPFAAHRHQRQERQAAACGQREHVHAIADAARLHQQHRAVAAEPGAGGRARRLPLRWSARWSGSRDRHGTAASTDSSAGVSSSCSFTPPPPGSPQARPPRWDSRRLCSWFTCLRSFTQHLLAWPTRPDRRTGRARARA